MKPLDNLLLDISRNQLRARELGYKLTIKLTYFGRVILNSILVYSTLDCLKSPLNVYVSENAKDSLIIN